MRWLRRLWNRHRIRAALKRCEAVSKRSDRQEATHQARMVAMSLSGGLFAVADPSRIPDDARSVSFLACHLYPASMRVEEGPYGRVPSEPPLAMACPECDLRQPSMRQGEARVCRYCGSQLQAHGTRIFVWNPTKVVEWTWPRASNAE